MLYSQRLGLFLDFYIVDALYIAESVDGVPSTIIKKLFVIHVEQFHSSASFNFTWLIDILWLLIYHAVLFLLWIETIFIIDIF